MTESMAVAGDAIVHCPSGCVDALSGRKWVLAAYGETQAEIYRCKKCRGLWALRIRRHDEGILTPELERVPLT